MGSVTIEDHSDGRTGLRVLPGGRIGVEVEGDVSVTGGDVNVTVENDEYILTNDEEKCLQGIGHIASLVDIALADDAYLQMLVEVPVDYYVRGYIRACCGGNAVLSVYEGTTSEASGTPVTSYNLRRRSTIDSFTDIWHTPTSSASGTLLHSQIVPGEVVGGLGFKAPILLDDETRYMFSLQNISGDAAPASLSFTYIEGTTPI